MCESEFKGQDLIPRIVVVAGILIGLFGFGSYLKSGQPAHAGRTITPDRIEPAAQSRQLITKNRSPEPAANSLATRSDVAVPVAPANSLGKIPPKAVVDERAYYCGAETKKGTPCSRRVKGKTRCFQHIGMPAMNVAAQ
ncbi:MAG: hypothetical protein ABR530_09000 [Pyrinomonadaceae bacterium]